MSAVSTYSITVEWGDCDPARIVFYPNYFAWFDAASRTLFESVNWPYARLAERFGIIGLPIAEVSAKFLRPSRYGQRVDFKSRIEVWQESRFTVLHQAYRDDALLLEGREVRFCGQAHPDNPERLRAIPIPQEFKQAFAT